MAALLLSAAQQGVRLRISFVGLSSPELHIQRVQARVSRGGHNIPEPKIRARWEASRKNLIRLLPHVAELALLVNSAEANLDAGEPPAPSRILWMQAGKIRDLRPLEQVPAWAKSIVAAAVASIAPVARA
jgi:hypothetical protein